MMPANLTVVMEKSFDLQCLQQYSNFLVFSIAYLITWTINARFLESWDICQVAIDLLQLSIRYLFVLLLEEAAGN